MGGWVMTCVWCGGWFSEATQVGNDSGVSCRWLLTSACAALVGAILALFTWGKAKDARIEELHKEKDAVQDARLSDFKDRYDRLARRKDKDANDT